MTTKIVLLRHGQSTWNLENRFTGWTDVDLSEQGLQEAHNAGKVLHSEDYVFDVAYTSVLKRAIRTLWITLDEMDLMWIPVSRTCLLYTSDAADDLLCVDLGGRRNIKNKKQTHAVTIGTHHKPTYILLTHL